MIEKAIEQAQGLVDALKELQAESDAEEAKPALAAVPEPSSDAEQVQTAEQGHDNSLPFKCPACGKTYETQVVCSNGHAPEATLPTADVLAGAEPADPAAEPAAQPAENAVVEESTVTPDPTEAASGADATASSSSTSEASTSTAAPSSDAPADPGPTWPAA